MKNKNVLSFDLISDLHLHLWKGEKPDYAALKRNDLVIVAGDMHRNPEEAAAVIREIAGVYKTVLFIDGNNEFRDAFLTDANFNIADTEDRLRLAAADIPNAIYLKDHTFVQDGVAIIGRNGHWDHKADPRITQEKALEEQVALVNKILNPESAAPTSDIRQQIEKQQSMGHLAPPSGRSIGIPEAMASVHQAQKDFEDMRDEVIRLNADKSIHTIIAVTHTVPHIPGSTLLNFPEKVTPRTMSTMANTQMASLKDHDAGGKLKYWIFGHQHDRKNQIVNGVAYIENPLGGPGEMYAPDRIGDYRPVSVYLSATAAPRVAAQPAPAGSTP